MGLLKTDVGFRYFTLLASLSDCLSFRAILVLIRTYWICRVVIRISRAWLRLILVPCTSFPHLANV